MKTTLLAVLLVFGLGVSDAMADIQRTFPAIKDAGITTSGEHTNRGGDSQISFCNGTVDSGEFGIFDFDRAAIRSYINAHIGIRTLQQAINLGQITVSFSLVPSGNVDPNAQVGLMSVYTDDNWVEGAGASGPGATTAYNWPGASTGTPACTSAAPNDYVGQGTNWHRTDTNAHAQQLQSIPGIYNSTTMDSWAMNVRSTVMLDDALWCSYIYGVDATDTSIPSPVSTMLRTYGFSTNPSPMTCYTKEAGAGYAPMLTVMGPFGAAPHPGDANGDLRVDVIDLGILAKNYDSTGLPVSIIDPWGNWRLGDFSGDGNVDVVDLGILAKNYGWSGGLPGVPEPATLSLLALGGLAMIRRARKV